jgi:two-component system sensor histidine kinase RegB
MTSPKAGDTSQSHNMQRLFVLRNLAIAWELITAVTTHLWIGIALPLVPLSVIITAHGFINLLTWLRLRKGIRISDRELLTQLFIDVTAFTAVLYLTGGATNPFAWFYLVPVIIAATVLPHAFTWAMAGITTLCYTLLLIFYVPLPGMGFMHHDGFGLHIFGMWFGFVLVAGLVAHFVYDMANSLRKQDRKLAEIREQALSDERLIALGTLAAGAAHELGTPLATMAILIKEMHQDYPDDLYPELHNTLVILKEQVMRCKEALSVISASAGDARAESGHPMCVQDYLKELLQQWHNQRPNVFLQYQQQAQGEGSRIVAERTLSQALINVLNNAADASPDRIEVDARWNEDNLVLEVSDQGAGLDPDATHAAGKTPFSTKEQGLGIGLVLAQATIRRLGGKIALSHNKGGGARSQIVLPLLTAPRIV